jgi:hypothetical protein
MKTFSRIFNKIVLSALLLAIATVKAEPLFTDGLESGSKSHVENGISYSSSDRTSVSTSIKKSGTYSLEFLYPSAALGQDSFAEQRMTYPQTNEIWVKYDLYIPNNFYHRVDSPSNNKFLAIFRTPYRSPGFQVNWSTSPNGSGGSNLGLYRYRNGSEQTTISPNGNIGNNFLTLEDRGKWVEIIAHVKVPSSSTANDGVMQMWKDGRIVTNETELNNYGGDGENHLTELYLLGWANSGYAEETRFYIDNISVSFEPFKIPNKPVDAVVN